MGLRQTTFNAVKAAMKAVGDLKVEVTYQRVVPGVYDPDTDITAETGDSYEFEAPLVGLTDEEQAWIAVDKKGGKLLVARDDLPVIPQVTDYCTIENERWEVVRVKRVPGDSVWIIVIQGA